MRRSLSLAFALSILVSLASLSLPAFATSSGAEFWTALDRDVVCGIAIHPPNTPPTQLLCGATHIPPPKTKVIGDPGFVFLGSTGRPELARLSQDSFEGSKPATLKDGHTWKVGAISVTCRVSVATVRCENRSHHGFTISKSSYRAF